MSKNLKLGISTGLVGAGVAFLIFSSLADAQYYKMVDEVVVAPDGWADKTMRVHGFVEPGSIREWIADQKTKRTFTLENQGKRLLVRHEGPVPDSFRDTAEIVASGRLLKERGEYVFVATELTAKCPSKYEGAPRTNRGGARASSERPLF